MNGSFPVLTFRFKVCEFLPLVGREYKHLPKFLVDKRASINVRNTDNRCLGYAIASALPSALGEVDDHYDRPRNYNALFHTIKLDKI